MKQLSSQKWILSTLLFAALGSQYYFSASSKNTGLIEMSELAATEQSIVEIAAALQRSRPPAPVAAPAPAPVVPAAQRTEAINPVAPCADCVTLTKAEAERIRQILVEVTGKKTAAKPEGDIAETPAEKMKREREEREEKRREDKLAKDEKKRDLELAKVEKQKDEQDLRDEKFRNDFDRLSARCTDVECYSSSISTALNRYTDKSKIISSKVVTEIFNEHIAKDLKEGLKDPENTASLSALETLMADLPTAYKSLKNKTIDIAKSVAAPKAIEANASFKQAEILRKSNKLNESSAAFSRATEQKAELEKMLKVQYEAIHDGTERAEDKATYTYYNMNYAKPASQWILDIMNSTNFSTGTTDSGAITAGANQNPLTTPTRGVVRGGNGSPVIGNQINNTIGNPINNTQNTINGQLGNQQTGFRGGRISN